MTTTQAFIAFFKSMSIPFGLVIFLGLYNYWLKTRPAKPKEMYPLPDNMESTAACIAKCIVLADSEEGIVRCQKLIVRFEHIHHDHPDITSEAKELRRAIGEKIMSVIIEPSLAV